MQNKLEWSFILFLYVVITAMLITLWEVAYIVVFMYAIPVSLSLILLIPDSWSKKE